MLAFLLFGLKNGNISIIWVKRGLSLSKAVGSAKAVGFDRLNQLHRELLRRYQKCL